MLQIAIATAIGCVLGNGLLLLIVALVKAYARSTR